MKKKLIICLLLCLTGIIAVAGCSKTNNAQNTQPAGSQVNANAGSGINQAMRQKPDLFGQVKTINGNDVTIAAAQVPQRDQNQSGQQNQQTQSQKPSDSTKGVNGQRGNWSLQLTGETKTITIPEGVKITSGGGPRGSGQGQQSQGQSQAQAPKEITVKDIKTGDIISVYYQAGTTTIDHITVRTAPQQ